jgi:nicotinic acid mononucleotide adenylyltransferase
MNKTKKKETKDNHNSAKYIELNPTINEASTKTVVLTFGRFNPPTIGHEKLVNKLISIADKEKAEPHVYLGHTQDKKKNPLSYTDKLHFTKAAFGPVIKSSSAKTILQVAKDLQAKFDKMILVVGQDRVEEFETLLNKYNGKEYNFETIEVVSAGERDPDADDVTGISSSKMRAIASLGNFEAFKKGLPVKLKNSAKEIYDSVREGMGIMEDILEVDLTEDLDEERKPLTIAQRRKRGMVMKRFKTKIKMAREKAKRRMASTDKLKQRAKRKARNIIRDRLMKSKSYSEMTPSEKIALDKRLMRISPAAINRIAVKQLPMVRKAEIQRLSDLHKVKNEEKDLNTLFEQFVNEPQEARKKKFRYLFTREGKVNCDQRFKMFRPKENVMEDLEADLFALLEAVEKLDKLDPRNREHGSDSLVKILKQDTPGEDLEEDYYTGLSKSTSAKRKAHFNKGAEMDDDNPAAYEPAPGDARAKTKPSIHTKNYEKQFKKEDLDLYESDPIAGIKKKAEETGIAYGILKKVFDRGVAAWRTGHRPGTTPAQWGFARINSFATGGKTQKTTDADLWAKHKGK